MHKFLVAVACLFHTYGLFAQGQLDSLPKALIRHEHTVGGYLYTNGWGVGYSYGKMNKAKLKTLYSTDFVVIHDPKEMKTTNPASSENDRFVYGKTHFLLNMRFSYGKMHRIFDKKDVGGIEIRYFYKAGPVFAFQKPIYYRIQSDDGKSENIEKFTNATHQLIGEINGKASFFKGFDEISIIPGIHAKSAISFEFGKQDLVINSVEGGVSVDIFPKTIELMANEYDKFVFVSLFLSLRFGKIINPRVKKSSILQ